MSSYQPIAVADNVAADFFCLDCMEKSMKPDEYEKLIDGGLRERYQVLLEDQDIEELHGKNCGECGETLCSVERDEDFCLDCAEERELLDKDIFAVRFLYSNDQNKTFEMEPDGTPLNAYYCRECALKNFRHESNARSLLNTFHIATDHTLRNPNVATWIAASPDFNQNQLVLQGTTDNAPIRVIPLYFYTPMERFDQRLHGRVCSECEADLCEITVKKHGVHPYSTRYGQYGEEDRNIYEECPCHDFDPEVEEEHNILRDMRLKRQKEVCAKFITSTITTKLYMIVVQELDAEGNFIREYVPLGYDNKLYIVRLTQEGLPEDLQNEIAALQKHADKL